MDLAFLVSGSKIKIVENNQVFGIFERIRKIIISSNSLLQLETSERLLELFQKQNIHPELNEKLKLVFVHKAETLHYFEFKRFPDCGLEAA